MRIGIISNTDSFIPFTYTLASQQLQVCIFFSPSKDLFANQRVSSFIQQTKLSLTEEKNKTKDLYKWLQDGNFDVCFILGYSYLIEVSRLKHLSTQLFNIHFGLLPMFRGPVPVFWQLKMGGETIGLTIHELNEKFDSGNIVWIKEIKNLPHYNYQTINQLFSQLCIEGVIHILRFVQIKMSVPVIQTHQSIAYQKRPGLNEVLINWQQMGATEICNLVRACNPWNKGALTTHNNQELKLMDAAIITAATDSQEQNISPGTITNVEGQLHVYCTDGNIININMVFYNECFIPAYQLKDWGIKKGALLV